MDKEHEKQWMMTAIMKEFNYRPPMSLEKICEGLVHQGYGNVAQAVREFAEKLKDEFWGISGDWQGVDDEELCEKIDELIKELYPDDTV